jgi:hypothetical protein
MLSTLQGSLHLPGLQQEHGSPGNPTGGFQQHSAELGQSGSKENDMQKPCLHACPQVTATGGALANIDRVVQDLKATVILYTLLAVCIHALAIWRGLLEAKQDATGMCQRAGYGQA